MNTEEVAKKVVELTRKQAWKKAIDTLYDKDIVSVEARTMDGSSPETRGIDSLVPDRSSRANCFGPESDCGENAKHDEQPQRDELGELEWRLSLRWSKRLQSRYFFE